MRLQNSKEEFLQLKGSGREGVRVGVLWTPANQTLGFATVHSPKETSTPE